MEQSQDIYAKAADELAGIDAQIAVLEKRRATLRQFVDLGQRLYADLYEPTGRVRAGIVEGQPLGVSKFAAFAKAQQANRAARESSLKARVLALSKQAIQAEGPRSTRDLLAYIQAAGVEVTGADKPTTVSVILSRSNEFASDRKVGWVLVDDPATTPAQKELTPQDGPTSAGSSTA